MTSRGAGLAWLLAAMLLLMPGVALAGQNPGIAFEDNRELKLTPESSEPLRTVVVCNVSDVDAAEPVAVVSTFQKGTDPPIALITASITGDKDKDKWHAGDCRNVVLTLAEGAKPDGGDYSGLLTVHTSVALARRRVTVTMPADPEKRTPTPAKSATDPATLTATRGKRGKSAKLDDPAQLLLVPATSEQELTVPRKCPQSRPTDTNPCPFVGNLVSGQHVAKVYVAGPVEEITRQPAKVKLRITGATAAGTYKGKVDLAQTATKPDDDISLTVTVKDAWWRALGALLLGAAFAFWLQYVVRTTWPKKRLRDRYLAFEFKYGSAITAFNGHRPLKDEVEDWSPPTATAIAAVNADIEEGITLYRKSTVYWDASSEGYKELDNSIAQVEDDIDCLQDETRLADGLGKLQAALDKLAKFLKDKYHPSHDPAFVLPATALLKGPKPEQGQPASGPLAVGQALTLHKSAKAATALVAAWTELAEDELEYDAWWDRLDKKKSDDGNWSDRDRATLEAAAGQLGVVRHELLTVEDADQLAELRTKRDLHRVREKLALLSGAHGGWPGEEDVDAVARPAAIAGRELAGSVTSDFADWLTGAPEWTSDPATAAKLRAVGGVLLASTIIAFTVLVAVATGLAAFYVGKDTWGTPEDYFTVIVVGAAAQALVQSVVDVVSKVLPPAPKQLITGPSAAVLKPPAATTT